MRRFRGNPWTFEWLELTAAKVARSVLRGRGGGNSFLLPDENNNVLKNHGYHFDHNFGHGKQHLSNTLATLNLLAFLSHTLLDLTDEYYKEVRERLGSRQRFFNDIRALTQYLFFSGWDSLMLFMKNGLDGNKSRAP